ncbi:hypothetical protein FKM82_017771 [Ascaphus truei]
MSAFSAPAQCHKLAYRPIHLLPPIQSIQRFIFLVTGYLTFMQSHSLPKLYIMSPPAHTAVPLVGMPNHNQVFKKRGGRT